MIRHERIAYISLHVTDLDRSARYYADIVGLKLTLKTNEQAFLTCGDDQYTVLLSQGDIPGIKRVAFELESEEEIERAYSILKEAGHEPQQVSDEECRSLFLHKAIRFQDPNGQTIEYFSGMIQHFDRFSPHPVKISRLGHVVIHAKDFQESLDFYTKTLNFKVSDFKCGKSGDPEFAFMRCFPNPYHHSFAIAAEGPKSYQHVAFMVTDIDDLGKAKNKLEKNNIQIKNGLGRHAASGSIFLYWLDPDNIMLEYTLGMEEFPEVNPRKPRRLDDTPQTSNIWLDID